MPLGMFRDTRYHEYYLSFEAGRILVLYTDGVTEAQNPSGRGIWSRSSGGSGESELRDLSARELIAELQRAVLDWTDGLGATTTSRSSSSKR